MRLQVKKSRLQKISDTINALRSKVVRAEIRLSGERSLASLHPTGTAIARVKKTLNRNFHLLQRLRILRSRKHTSLRAIHFLKRSIQRIASKLKDAQKLRSEPVPFFGPRKLFRAQFHLDKTDFSSKEAWLGAWREARSNCLFIEGDKSAPCGNRFARVQDAGHDFDLELRLPERLAAVATSSYPCKGRQIHALKFKGLNFHHGRPAILAALASGLPISVRFHRDHTSWKVSVTIFQETEVAALDWGNGSLGVDWNAGKIVAAHIDRHGNFVRSFTFPCSTKGNTANQTADTMRKVACRIVSLAHSLRVPLVNEQLDFSEAKTSRRALGDSRFAKMVTAFPYSSFTRAIRSACERRGVALETVSSSHTTRVGRIKFARRYGLSGHQAAAMVIARRAMKFSEQLSPRKPSHADFSIGLRHPTVTREERKACATGRTGQINGEEEGATGTRVVPTNDVETMLRACRRTWWSNQPLHDLSGLSGRSLRYRFSRGSEGWEPRRE
ncbi:hypothetical protein ACIQUB_07875 [Rhizobium sp. NPDC090275]|uniref:hypothetical protein n=1 Tax=Rhizobium sp. NPDC090275 TaxID=3364498 RepID=UPI00383BE379